MEITRMILCCLWLGLVTVGQAQRTYRRTCDCEYTVDGRCAYTLLLPGPAEGTKGQCPQVEGGKEGMMGEGDREQVQMHLEQLKANVTDLRLAAGDQARMLSQLQSVLLTQQESLGNIRALVNSQTPRSDSTPAMDSTPGATPASTTSFSASSSTPQQQPPCELCPQVAADLRDQQQRVNALQEQVNALQNSLLNLGNSLSNIGTLFPMEELQRQFELQQNQTAQLQRSLAEIVQNATMSLQPSDLLPFACIRRGLLVSGREKNITDDQITASSTFNDGHAAVRGRIYTMQEGTLQGAWCAKEPNAPEEWLQFDLGKTKSVFGVVTKGRYDYGQWVTTYSLNYTETDPAMPNSKWMQYVDVLGDVMTFIGNTDQNTPQVNMLWQPIRARFIRIIPLTSDSNKCLRADVIGCLDEQ